MTNAEDLGATIIGTHRNDIALLLAALVVRADGHPINLLHFLGFGHKVPRDSFLLRRRVPSGAQLAIQSRRHDIFTRRLGEYHRVDGVNVRPI